MMELNALWQEVSLRLDRIDFSALTPGFRRYRFALYTEKTVCLDGKILPWDERFRGNTAILFDGEQIAIWDVGNDPIHDMDQLAASMVHEMFHCHQYTLGEKRFPSDLTLLDYPEDGENYARKYYENCLLADAYEHYDTSALEKFAAVREMRLAKYPRMVREELRAETLEGMAEFVGLKALEQLSREKFAEKVSTYLRTLRAEDKLQLDIRRMSYFTGTILHLALERLGRGVKNEIDSELTVYEQNPIESAETVIVPDCPFIEALCAETAAEKRRKIEEHIAVAPFTACEGRICGYDPMNMFRSGRYIFCSHFVMLKVEEKMEMFPRRIVLLLKDGSRDEVEGYY